MFSTWRMINKVLEDRDVVIPKYIDKKIDRLNSLLEQAYGVRSEIETWAKKTEWILLIQTGMKMSWMKAAP